jgi:hypothetical protein
MRIAIARTSRLVLTVALRQKRRHAGREGALTSNAAPRLTAMLHDDDVGGNAASSANASQSWRRSRLSARRMASTGQGRHRYPQPGAYGTRDCWDSASKQTNRTVCTYQIMLTTAFLVGEEQTHMPLQTERMQSNLIGKRKADAEKQEWPTVCAHASGRRGCMGCFYWSAGTHRREEAQG